MSESNDDPDGIQPSEDEDTLQPSDVGEGDAPPIDAKPYKIIFEANLCFGAGKCASESPHWELDLDTGLARPRTYHVGEDDLEHHIRAAESCPAKKGRGVIHLTSSPPYLGAFAPRVRTGIPALGVQGSRSNHRTTTPFGHR